MPKYMFCFAIIPNTLKMQAAKKYYDFAAQYEMNDLYRTGIYGVRVIMYGTTLNSPGRREILSIYAYAVSASILSLLQVHTHVATGAIESNS